MVAISPTVKEAVKRRDHYKCVICGKPDQHGEYRTTTIVHHINENPYDNRLENLATLCQTHHLEWHQKILPKILQVYYTDNFYETDEIHKHFQNWVTTNHTLNTYNLGKYATQA